MGRALQKGSTEKPGAEAGEWMSSVKWGVTGVARTYEKRAESHRHKLSVAVRTLLCHAEFQERHEWPSMLEGKLWL